ncbi:hypothetical protein GS597_17295 [Synechococcales cyanobacterium C]|uniref:Uncharacterized protein n=1 Tax=Petrachloros mirabilis ULC683 TaxID=2781853 RepID=A0A8K2A9I3_9CYAN|nr:hypothetical protein [Petrachloros mirabilis]NCJ08230.1 hypothetical protein [Petrachloros mirabilis ULC683]
MARPKYTRSKGQVLHRFEPGAVATAPAGTAEIFKHFARKQDNLRADLRDAVEQELRRWRHFDSQMQAFLNHTADLVPVDIASVQGQRLQIRECAKCGAIRNTGDPQWRKQPDAVCHQCEHPTLNEIPFVFAHADGTMLQLTPEPCPEHGYRFLILERTASKRWRCRVSGCSHTKQINRALSTRSLMRQPQIANRVQEATGRLPNPMMSLSPVSDKKLQVVHSISRIDPTPNFIKFKNLPEALYTLLCIHLEYLDWTGKPLLELHEVLSVVGSGSQEDQTKEEQLIQTMRESGLDEAIIQTILSKNKAKQENNVGGPVVSQVRQALDKLPTQAIDLLGDSQAEAETHDRGEALTLKQDNARTLREQLINRGVLLDLKRESIDATIQRLSGSPFSFCLETARDDMRTKLGITQVEVIQDLPIMHLAYGYTRLSHQPEAAVLWAFDRTKFDLAGDEPTGNWIPAPVYKLETEALSFQFDSRRILRWLHANNLAPDSQTISEPTLWLLQRHSRIHCRSGPAFSDALDPDFLIPWLVGSAIHSATHLMIRAIADQSSFGETALSEHLLLSLNQTIIFVNRLQEFSLGGLKTFFEQRLDQAFKNLLEERSDCMFDPYCEETLGGACAGCLHLPEVVCRLFNNALSRILLYGGDLRTDIEGDGSERTLWKNPNLEDLTGQSEFIGFWDRRID